MDIPKDIEAWMAGAPWVEVRGSLFSAVVFAKKSGIPISPLTIYQTNYADRRSHELAHLVVCKDSDVLDPYWGVNEFSTDNNPALSKEACKIETEVTVVNRIIDTNFHYGHDPLWVNDKRAVAITISDSIFPIVGEDVSFEEVVSWASESINKWDLEKIWAELQRKYALIAKQLGDK